MTLSTYPSSRQPHLVQGCAGSGASHLQVYPPPMSSAKEGPTSCHSTRAWRDQAGAQSSGQGLFCCWPPPPFGHLQKGCIDCWGEKQIPASPGDLVHSKVQGKGQDANILQVCVRPQKVSLSAVWVGECPWRR